MTDQKAIPLKVGGEFEQCERCQMERFKPCLRGVVESKRWAGEACFDACPRQTWAMKQARDFSDWAIPRRFQNAKLGIYDLTRGNFEETLPNVECAALTAAHKRAGEFLEAQSFDRDRLWSRAWGIRIAGKVGRGKTHLAAAIANTLHRRNGLTYAFVPMPKLFAALRATFNDREATEQHVLGPLREADILVLDDIGAENVTDYTETTVFEMIDERVRECRPFIVTTKVAPSEMSRSETWGSTFSRLMSDEVLGIIVEGGDLRVKGEAA